MSDLKIAMSFLPNDLQVIVMTYLFDLEIYGDMKTFMYLMCNLKWFRQLNMVLSRCDLYINANCFAETCRLGDLEMCAWILQHSPFASMLNVRDAFCTACFNGHLHVAAYLCPNLNIREKIHVFSIAFFHACIEGHLFVAQWLNKHSLLPITYNEEWSIYSLLARTCINGHFAVAQWLLYEFDISHIAMRWDCVTVFQHVCEHGQLDMAQWIEKHFNVEVIDMFQALIEACTNGHLHVAKWITKHFDITDDYNRNFSYPSLCGAIENGHLILVQWLVKEFHVGLLQHGFGGFAIISFKRSCNNEHLHVVQWLCKEFNLTKADVMKCLRIDIYPEIRDDSNRVVQWLVREFNL